jgi:hypothetical protein
MERVLRQLYIDLQHSILPTVPPDGPSDAQLRKKIVELSRIYAWGCVLQVALEHHCCIVDAGVTDYTIWEIPQSTILHLCPFDKQLSYTSTTTA